MNARGSRFLAALPLVIVVACRGGGAASTQRATRSVPAGVDTSSAVSDAIAAIRKAEYSRTSTALPKGALVDHDVRVRRAGARALARIGDEASVTLLAESLDDEDGEVVAWSAYGLGLSCPGREPATVRKLVTRAASLDAAVSGAGEDGAPSPSAFAAIADALARCGSVAAEQTLAAWLEGPAERSESAARSLGRLAGRRHRLDDRTLVALLDAAARPSPVIGALYPFSLLGGLSRATEQRLLSVASQAATSGADPFAISALASAGSDAAGPLSVWLSDARRSASARSASAVALRRLGPEARDALGAALSRMVTADMKIDESWFTANFAPLLAALSALDEPVASAKPALARLSDLPIPPDAPPFTKRRIIALRCAAASILAGTASQSVRLLRCDPDEHGHAGALAVLRVLDRGTMEHERLDVWRPYARSADPGVRRVALSLLERHPEMSDVVDVIVSALSAKEPGVVAQAARAIADTPRIAAERAGAALATAPSGASGAVPEPRPEVVQAVARAMDAKRPADQIEPRVALTEAAAALGVLSLKARVERYCRSSNITLRRSAEAALRELGSAGASCPAPAGPRVAADLPAGSHPVTLTFVTDAGRLGMTLDPTLAPLSVARIVDLVRSGFYDGIVIRRVNPGFVVQLGDPVGDGSGGSGRAPLLSEDSPVEFKALSVGLALAGRDTGSSQIFVALAAAPQLFGDYPVLGRADPEWATVAPGDVIRSVEIRE